MGTKNNPGEFDCYDNAKPDEPMFILLGRDALAPYLVEIWAAIRAGNRNYARQVFRDLMVGPQSSVYVLHPEDRKPAEAQKCSAAMVEWRKSAAAPQKGEG